MVALARTRPQPPAGNSEFAADVSRGLNAAPKRVPAKYFYDDAGSLLFERITHLPEYYPTRCEMGILRAQAADVAKLIPEGAALIEFGAGANKKARILLRAAPQLSVYVPVDICGEMIEQRGNRASTGFSAPQGAAGDRRYHANFRAAGGSKAAPMRVGFFPGSTIGNFEPHEAAAFLRNAAQILGRRCDHSSSASI